MKTLFLIPPSEGKNPENKYKKEVLSFDFEKPIGIAKNATQKDLKCKGDRYKEAINLNADIEKSGTINSISRYAGVMYNAIDYKGMTNTGKAFFEDNFLVLSAMYGILRPLDHIGNYKLPVEAKGLYDFWGESILEAINNLKPDLVVNLLPISYAKLIVGKNKSSELLFSDLKEFKLVNVNFLDEQLKKISHGVKKIKGEWIKDICEKAITDYNDFGGDVIEREDNIVDINIVIK